MLNFCKQVLFLFCHTINSLVTELVWYAVLQDEGEARFNYHRTEIQSDIFNCFSSIWDK